MQPSLEKNKKEWVMLVTKKFSFDSAHKLLNYQGKCQFLHGHTYFLYVTAKGQIDKKTGLAIDFKIIKELVEKKVLAVLDHQYLNKVIKQPTAENIAIWIWGRLEKELNLFKIEIWETPDSYVEYYGENS
jgi:6-pyruvoyltetrahydropterin/6-carboxytetrahydropterin synthase